jgi:hypothetical protein
MPCPSLSRDVRTRLRACSRCKFSEIGSVSPPSVIRLAANDFLKRTRPFYGERSPENRVAQVPLDDRSCTQQQAITGQRKAKGAYCWAKRAK